MVLQRGFFYPRHLHKSYVQQCMLRQDTLRVLQADSTYFGIILGVYVVINSLNQSLWLHMLIISVALLCFHPVTSA